MKIFSFLNMVFFKINDHLMSLQEREDKDT